MKEIIAAHGWPGKSLAGTDESATMPGCLFNTPTAIRRFKNSAWT